MRSSENRNQTATIDPLASAMARDALAHANCISSTQSRGVRLVNSDHDVRQVETEKQDPIKGTSILNPNYRGTFCLGHIARIFTRYAKAKQIFNGQILAT
jgi:hypothetical protein